MGSQKLDVAFGLAALACGVALGLQFVSTTDQALSSVIAAALAAAFSTVTFARSRNALAVPSGLLLGPVVFVAWLALRDDALDDPHVWIAAAIPVVLLGVWLAPSLRTLVLTSFVIVGVLTVQVGLALQEDQPFAWTNIALTIGGLLGLWVGSASPLAVLRDVTTGGGDAMLTSAGSGASFTQDASDLSALEAVDDSDSDGGADKSVARGNDDGWQFPTIKILGFSLRTVILVVLLAVGVVAGGRYLASASHEALGYSPSDLKGGTP